MVLMATVRGIDALVARIRAQLDEDERLAQVAAGRYPVWSATEDGTVCQEATGGSGYLATGPYGELFEVGHHMARHDPARVLRKVKADRAILDWCVEVIGDRDLSRYGQPGALGDDPNALAVTLAVETIRNLAAGMSDQPGDRTEWAPTS